MAVLVILASCGGSEPGSKPAKPPPRTGAAPTTPAGVTPDRVGSEPKVDADLTAGDEPFAAPPAGATASAAGLRLVAARGASTRLGARRTVRPGTAGTNVVAQVRDPQRLDGRAGVFCRGTADGRTGYELSVDRRGSVRVDRVDGGRRIELVRFQAGYDPKARQTAPLPLVLVCGAARGDTPLSLSAAVGAQQPVVLRDRRPALDPGADARIGVLVSGPPGATATFTNLRLFAPG